MDKKKEMAQDVKETFGTEHGKRVLAKMETLSTFHKSSVKVDGKIDPNRIIYDEGARSVLLWIHRQLKIDLGKPKQEKAKND